MSKSGVDYAVNVSTRLELHELVEHVRQLVVVDVEL